MTARPLAYGLFLPLMALVGCGADPVSATSVNTEDAGPSTPGPDASLTNDVDAGPVVPPRCAAEDPAGVKPVVFWPKPVRAYPGIPFSYSMVGYDPDGEDLCFVLEGAPPGMTIDGKGDIAWSPTDADVRETPYQLKVGVVTAKGGRRDVDVALVVGKAGFVFAASDVAPGGDGSFERPYATIERGLEDLGKKVAKTLVVRGGTFATNWVWEANGVKSPLRGVKFTAEDPAEVIGYPGEKVVIECAKGSHGIWAYDTEFVLIRDLEVRGASHGERGGAIAHGKSIVFEQVIVRDSNWANSNNCSGFLLAGDDIVVHRCEAHDNYDRENDGVRWNSANYLAYADIAEGYTMYMLDSVSSGSAVGFKVKHAGPGRVVAHRVRDEKSDMGWGGTDDGTSVRFSTFVGEDVGIYVGMTDPSSATNGQMVIEHNTVVRPSQAPLSFQTSYAPTVPDVVRANLFYVDKPFAAPEEGQWMLDLFRYEDAPSLAQLTFEENCYSGLSDASGFRVGKAWEGFAAWKARGKDGSSVWGDPSFLGPNDFHLAPTSPCRLPSGVVAGALR